MVTNGELPEKRSHHTSVIEGHRLIVFGGLSQEGKRLNDLHVLDLCTFRHFCSVILLLRGCLTLERACLSTFLNFPLTCQPEISPNLAIFA